MNIFKALYGQFEGAFGKVYVLAGLVPAVLFVFVWQWFDRNIAAAELIILFFDAFSGTNARETVTFVVAALAVALLLHTTREFVLVGYQRLPGPMLAVPRGVMTQLQLRKFRRVKERSEHASHEVTLANWPKERRNFATPEYLPSFERAAASIHLAAKCREAVDGYSKGWRQCVYRWTTYFAEREMLCGLRTLYVCAKEKTTGVGEEVAQWREFLKQELPGEVLEFVGAAANRKYVETRLELDNYPDLAWLRPTSLGTRAAAIDDYAKKRYGIDTTTLLTRLLGILDKTERSGLSDARLSVQMLTNLSLVSTVLFGKFCWHAGTSLLKAHQQGWSEVDLRMISFLAIALLSAWAFYRGAVMAYGTLETEIVRLVDLKRLQLIRALGFGMPENLGQERELWSDLEKFLSDAEKIDESRPLRPEGTQA